MKQNGSGNNLTQLSFIKHLKKIYIKRKILFENNSKI